MTEELTRALRVELDRIAQAGGGFEPDPQTWARGRRARVRDRAVTVVAVAAAVVCLAAIGLIARPHGQMAAPADSPDRPLGIPRTIWSVPERLAEHTSKPPGDESTWDDRIEETDLAIGRGAVALAAGSDGELAVVITAADGRYHPLALPGYLQAGLINHASARDAPLALSPDGKRLAYGWWDPAAPLDHPMPAGVRIVDLEDGTVSTIGLVGGNGVRVRSISWSPDSRWIGWMGDRTKSWTPASYGAGADALIAGRISPDGVPSTMPKTLNNFTRAAITSTGVLAVHDGSPRLITWNGTRFDRHPLSPDADAATAWSPSGRWLAISTPERSERFTYAGSDGSQHQITLPVGDGDDADLTPLGWLDDSTVVVAIQPVRVDEDMPDKILALIGLPPKTGDAQFTVIGRIRAPAPANLSIAVDLLSADRATVERPEPQWPWSDERKVWTVVLALLCLVLTGGLVNRWARKRSDNATPRPDVRPDGVS